MSGRSPYYRCGACGRRGANVLWADTGPHRVYVVHCRYCGASATFTSDEEPCWPGTPEQAAAALRPPASNGRVR